jgi:5'-3' exonuclease
MDKVLLIDLFNQLWRASIGFSAPKTKVPLGYRDETDQKYVLIYNFFRNLRPLIELLSPDKVFMVSEGHPKHRYELYADYKANRIIKTAEKKSLSDRFQESKNEIVRLFNYLPVTFCRAADYEADDTIASLCDNLNTEHLTVLSSDSDYIQLLQRGYKNIQIYNPIKKEYMQSPQYPYVVWKCLAGDKSDNIPSLLGPKKAIATVTNPDLLKKFLAIEENRANFSINRKLIEFANVPDNEIEMVEGIKNFAKLRSEFTRMDFQSMINPTSWTKYCKTFDCIKY